VSVTGSIDDVFPQRVEDLARQVKAAAAAISLALSGGAAPERMRA
jgi:hypothetical protein